MHHPRRRKKRHTHGLRTVELTRSKSGYGFTISGQQPCILSCIVNGSPADCAGLKTGDFLMGVNGLDISLAPHDDVVRMVGSSIGLLVLQIAENYNSSDSSSDEFGNRPKSKYPNRKQRQAQTRALDDAYAPYGSDRIVGHGAGLRPNRKPHDHRRARSPGMELKQMDYEPRPCHHHKLRGLENLQPGVMHHKSRHRHPLPPPQKERTKHTIITREHRLGLKGSVSSRQRLRTPVGAEAIPEGRMTPKDLSNILYPSIQPQLASHTRLEQVMIPYVGDSTKAVVGYVGSVEMPRDSRLPSSSLQSVRSAVRRLRIEKKIHTLVLMEVMGEGIRLINQMAQEVAVYPAGKVAFSGTCPDDKRFFGVVTQHGLSMEEINVDSTIDESALGSSCHVFMVDPDLVPHSRHANKARQFGLRCTPNPQTQECLEFPPTPSLLLQVVVQLYEDRQADLYTPQQPMLEPAPMLRNSQRSDSTSSNGADSGLGFGHDGCADQVCVVDVPSSAPQPDVSMPWDSENSSSAFTALSSLSESQTGSNTSFLSATSQERCVTSANLMLSTTSSFESSHDASHNQSSCSLLERLNPRVTGNPAGRAGALGMSRQFSSSNLLDAQHSADVLRWNAHRIMQKHLGSKSETEAVQGVPRGRSSSSLHMLDSNSKQEEPSKPEPQAFLAPGPVAGGKQPMPSPVPASIRTVPATEQARTPVVNKPPLPERKPVSTKSGPRTPVKPPGQNLCRPKSTPPLRLLRESSVVGLTLMEREKRGSDFDVVENIMETFESWPPSGNKPQDGKQQIDKGCSDGHTLHKVHYQPFQTWTVLKTKPVCI